MTDKEIKIEYESFDKYEGWDIRPSKVAIGMQANIGNGLKIRCSRYHDQLKNKLYIDQIIEVLKTENLL